MTPRITARPTRTPGLRAVTALTLAAGVTCQFVQRTDPTPPLLYFTVDSALLALVALLAPRRRPAAGAGRGVWAHRVRAAAVVGVLLSALVYVLVIVPGSPSGSWFAPHDDVWVRVATVLLHGVAPVLVLVEFLAGTSPGAGTLSEAALLVWWPAAYLAVVATLAWSGAAAVPYVFLRPSEFGAGATAAVVAVLCATVVALGAALSAVHRLVARKADEGRRSGLLG